MWKRHSSNGLANLTITCEKYQHYSVSKYGRIWTRKKWKRLRFACHVEIFSKKFSFQNLKLFFSYTLNCTSKNIGNEALTKKNSCKNKFDAMAQKDLVWTHRWKLESKFFWGTNEFARSFAFWNYQKYTQEKHCTIYWELL